MAAVLSESVLDQNGPNDHVGQNDLIPNRILALARPKRTKMVHFGLKRSILVRQPYSGHSWFKPANPISILFGKSNGGGSQTGAQGPYFHGIFSLGKSDLFGADWRLFMALWGLIRADQDQSSHTLQFRGDSGNCFERALVGLFGAFLAKPRLLRTVTRSVFRSGT